MISCHDVCRSKQLSFLRPRHWHFARGKCLPDIYGITKLETFYFSMYETWLSCALWNENKHVYEFFIKQRN
ncbi:MAG TPA: hypothetical protein DET40_02960 [Lentisphaeria bacterium]|nr:MAG: hypothetical protein A2X45_14145 [Lentisphaerae bacterium GWF2_50_93]HCE42490.1 hypothetical protein [Lentisphaeria bacterium]